ncbi:MAG: ABC transporter ATP-binding protein [Planctomycetes bacterium]|nr:ABC transporter ATP-binding protein [Planctomycetota bacterium]
MRIEGLVKTLRGNHVLDGVNLEIKRAETFVIIGRSGTGKSVLLKHIIGLMQPDKGHILIAGEDITRMNEEEMRHVRKRVGMLFQGAALLNSLTVGQNVGLGLTEGGHHGEKEVESVVKEKLALVGLDGKQDLMPAEISGGMKKRVGLARALALEPEVLLYDEPTAGLDPVMSQNIDDLIVSMKKQLNMTSVVVTHDMISTLTIADRVAMLDDGKIVTVGTPREIENSSEPVVREFIKRDANWRRKS